MTDVIELRNLLVGTLPWVLLEAHNITEDDAFDLSVQFGGGLDKDGMTELVGMFAEQHSGLGEEREQLVAVIRQLAARLQSHAVAWHHRNCSGPFDTCTALVCVADREPLDAAAKAVA